jgi:hypothetical protein
MRRDGFGYVSVLDPKKAKANDTFRTGTGSLMTVLFEITESSARLEANVELAAGGRVSFELLNRGGKPVPGYAAVVERSGVRVPVNWNNQQPITPGVYRLRATVERRGDESPQIYAFYVTTTNTR